MKLNVNWEKPIALKLRKVGFGYSFDVDIAPSEAGVYVFARIWGKGYEVLYVGQAQNIRVRLKQHLKNLDLMNHIAQASLGKRVVIAGVFQPKPGQKSKTSLPLIERALIRHFLSEGHDLVNKHGARLWHHELAMHGQPKMLVPKTMHLAK